MSGGEQGNANYTRGNYFSDKDRRQQERDEHLRGISSTIFQNCIIYVNGYTKPWNRLKLHKEIIKNGGRFKQYLSAKSNITHIIASNLTLKKKLEFKNYKKVISPQWIIDSIHQNKLLPWQDYSILYGDGNDATLSDQKKLTFLQKNKQTAATISCTDPNFIENYYSNSRLHLLSNWKTSLRDSFLQNFNNNKISLPTPKDNLRILHIDFDSFFATVAYLYRPSEFIDVDFNRDPIVVCHGSNNSDIASCNYVARKFGIKNGMWVSHARSLLPSDITLVTLPYNFQEFKNISTIFYDTLHEFQCFKHLIIPISIDEALAILVETNNSETNAISTIDLCQSIRCRIFENTQGCTVSIGVGNSQIDARLALKLAKPDGFHIISNGNADQDKENSPYLEQLSLSDMPSLGPSSIAKIKSQFPLVKNLLDLKNNVTALQLRNCLGNKLGSKIFNGLRGMDDPETQRLIFETNSVFAKKSISMEINWGIRFQNIGQIYTFLDRAANYLTRKLNDQYLTSQIILKVMKRAATAPIDPPKFLGMGHCDAFSQSSNMGLPTKDCGLIATELKNLYRIIGCPPLELRGIGVQFTKLSLNKTPHGNVNIPSNQRLLPFSNTDVSSNMGTYSKAPGLVTPKLVRELSPQKSKRKISPLKNSNIYNDINDNNDMGIDLSSTFQREFMNELPTQIRTELNRNLKIEQKVKKSKLGELQRQIAKRQNHKALANIHFVGKESLFEQIRFQGESNFKKICSMVRNWIDQTITDTNGPHPKDVQLFQKYLTKLANSNRLHLVLQFANIISSKLNIKSISIDRQGLTQSGVQEWDKILLNVVIPILNQNKHTFKSERKLNIEFEV